MPSVPKGIRQQVMAIAQHCCEYCQTQERLTGMPLVLDHITPLVLDGSSDLDNLAASCYRCNQFKGSKTESIDSVTHKWVGLFHPRQQLWPDHFAWVDEGLRVAGLTPTGRATVDTLKLNNPYVVEARRIWVAENWHPPNLSVGQLGDGNFFGDDE